MNNTLRRCGVPNTHDTYPNFPKDNAEGIVGSEKWLFRMDEFSPVVHQIRNPLAYMNTHILKGDLKYPHPYLEMGPFNKDDVTRCGPGELQMKMHMLMIWYRAMTFIQSQPQIVYTYRIEDMHVLGDAFKETLVALGYDPEEYPPPTEKEWSKAFTFNKNLPPPWERNNDELEWPDVSKWSEMERKLDLCKELAVKYGYKA